MKISPAVKVGILTVLATIILILSILWLKGRSISVGERIEVKFHDIDGMRPGSAVQMMGLRVGQVDEVIPVIDGENSHVKVRFVVTEPTINIPDASTISIQQSGIIGEKFLEVTPPFPKTVYIPTGQKVKKLIEEGSKVELLISGKYLPVGEVKEATIIDTRTVCVNQRKGLDTPYTYKIDYIITRPGIVVPKYSSAEIIQTKDNKHTLRIDPPDNLIVTLPEYISKYTVIEPVRLKDFFDIQLESAVALKETNDKVNNLLSIEFIDDVRVTVENTKDLSEKAFAIMDQAAEILASSKNDIKTIITLSSKLSANMIALSENINDIIGDSEFKENLIATTKSIRVSSDEISGLLGNSKLQESLLNINTTSEDLSEVVKYINELTKDEKFSTRLDETLVNLNTSITKLSKVVDTVDELTTQEKENLKEILSNSSDISNNLKGFSDKLNKRFLLLRLMF